MVQYSTEGRTNERSEPFCENDSSFTAPPSMSGLATHNLPTGRATFTVTGMLVFNVGAGRVPLTSRHDRSSVLVKLRKWTTSLFSILFANVVMVYALGGHAFMATSEPEVETSALSSDWSNDVPRRRFW